MCDQLGINININIFSIVDQAVVLAPTYITWATFIESTLCY